MKKFLLIGLVLLSSCTQRGCQKWDKDHQYTERTYNIKVYSGGQVVFEDSFTGIINGEEGTDGFYYFKGGKLIEISGDYIITSGK